MERHFRLVVYLVLGIQSACRGLADESLPQFPESHAVKVSNESLQCIVALEEQRVLTGSTNDNVARVLSLPQEEVVREFELSAVLGAVVDPYERVFFCTLSVDRPVECWNSRNWGKIFEVELKEDADIAYCVSVSRDGKRFAFALGEGGVAVCEANYGKVIARLDDGDTEQIVGLSFDHDGDRLAMADFSDNSVEIWDLNQEKVIDQVVAPSQSGYPSCFLQFVDDGEDESLFLVHPEGGPGKYDGEIKRLDVGGVQTTDAYRFGCISRDRRHMAMDWGKQGVLVWNLNSGNPVGIAAHKGQQFTCAVFSRDGRSLITGGPDGVVRVHEFPQSEDLPD